MFKPQPQNPEYVKRQQRAEVVLKTYHFASGRDSAGKRIVLLASPAGEQYRCSADHTCTCADFQIRGQAEGIPCKHLLAAYKWLRAQKAGHPVPAPAAAPYNSPAVPDRERAEQLRAELFGEPEPASIMTPAPSGEQAPAAEVPMPAAPASLTPIAELLATAKQHLKFPKIQLTCEGQTLELTLAGEKSRTPGSVMITNGLRYEDPQKRFWGRITPEGEFIPNRKDCGVLEIYFRQLLHLLAADPAGMIAAQGKMTSACCLCQRDLNDDRSLAVGYGPVCAKHWGLPWGDKPQGHTPEQTTAIRARRAEDFPEN